MTLVLLPDQGSGDDVDGGREPQQGLLGEGDVDAESPDSDESPGPLLPGDSQQLSPLRTKLIGVGFNLLPLKDF